jgi:hypothetical protein
MPPIPWTAILTHAPALVRAAKGLLARAPDEKQTLDTRLDRLENTSLESARLLDDIAQQFQALAMAQEQTARRARIALTLGVVAIVVGIGAGILAVIW